MLKNLYVPSDFKTPHFEEVTDEMLFESLRYSAPEVSVESFPTKSDCGALHEIVVDLPYGSFASGSLTCDWADGDDILLLKNLFVGEKRLLGSGTGTRLLRSFVRAGLEIKPQLPKLSTVTLRLGAANTLIGIFGAERVQLQRGNSSESYYGWDTDKPLEKLLEDKPHIPDEPYLIAGSVVNLTGITAEMMKDV